MLSRPDLTVPEACDEYIAQGALPVALRPREKRPSNTGWPKETPKSVRSSLKPESNIGLALGDVSDGLIDIDLDCPIARRLAPRFLPPTPARHGRPLAPQSHWWYRITGEAPATVQFLAPSKQPGTDKNMIVEVRATGGQTMVPPSIHPDTGERLEWAEVGAIPAAATWQELHDASRNLATVSLVARGWPSQGGRHDAALALSGTLVTGGMELADAEGFIDCVCEGAEDDDRADRMLAARTTFSRWQDGESVTGAAKLSDILGADVVRKVDEWLGLNRAASKPAAARGGSSGLAKYEQDEDGTYVCTGQERSQIADFSAKIARTVRVKDGLETAVRYRLSSSYRGRQNTFEIDSHEFEPLHWVMIHVDAAAQIAVGRHNRDHLLNAIRAASTQHAVTVVHASTGWTSHGGADVYVHAGGAIGADGVVLDVEVELPDLLQLYRLPAPPAPDRLAEAVSHSLWLLDVADDPALALLAAVYRAPLGRCDLILQLTGPTGAGKSELAARGQQHFGAAMDREHLPASWISTANANADLAHVVADAVLTIDDYAPDVANAAPAAARVMRGAGNGAGRQRLGRGGRLLPARPPRGLLISTGEDEPQGKSLAARFLSVPLRDGSVNWEGMTRAQHAGAQGHFAAAMAGFIQDTARRLPQIQRHRPGWARRLAGSLGEVAHPRFANAGAELLVGWAAFLLFARRAGAISRIERKDLWRSGRAAVTRILDAQRARLATTDPAGRFVELLASALASGMAHVTTPEKTPPLLPGEDVLPATAQRGPLAWGWRNPDVGWQPGGDHIGFIDDGSLYLLPNEVYRVVDRAARAQGSPLGATIRTLWALLDDRHVLLTRDQARSRFTIRKGLAGVRQEVLHLDPHTVVEREKQPLATGAPLTGPPLPFRVGGYTTAPPKGTKAVP